MICAVLVREPFNLRLSEIEQLTDWQIVNVYFRPNDNDDPADGYRPARPKDPEKRPPPVEVRAPVPPVYAFPDKWKTMFWNVWHARGLGPAAIEERWRATDKGKKEAAARKG